MKPHRGVTILVLGILSLVFGCFPIGIVAWIMGKNDLKDMEAGTMDPSGRGQTQAGKICGMISVILAILGVLAAILIFGLGVLGVAASQS
jgi:hypothetical protein